MLGSPAMQGGKAKRERSMQQVCRVVTGWNIGSQCFSGLPAEVPLHDGASSLSAFSLFSTTYRDVAWLKSTGTPAVGSTLVDLRTLQ